MIDIGEGVARIGGATVVVALLLIGGLAVTAVVQLVRIARWSRPSRAERLRRREEGVIAARVRSDGFCAEEAERAVVETRMPLDD